MTMTRRNLPAPLITLLAAGFLAIDSARGDNRDGESDDAPKERYLSVSQSHQEDETVLDIAWSIDKASAILVVSVDPGFGSQRVSEFGPRRVLYGVCVMRAIDGEGSAQLTVRSDWLRKSGSSTEATPYVVFVVRSISLHVTETVTETEEDTRRIKGKVAPRSRQVRSESITADKLDEHFVVASVHESVRTEPFGELELIDIDVDAGQNISVYLDWEWSLALVRGEIHVRKDDSDSKKQDE